MVETNRILFIINTQIDDEIKRQWAMLDYPPFDECHLVIKPRRDGKYFDYINNNDGSIKAIFDYQLKHQPK